jgi:hypothetical protein
MGVQIPPSAPVVRKASICWPFSRSSGKKLTNVPTPPRMTTARAAISPRRFADGCGAVLVLSKPSSSCRFKGGVWGRDDQILLPLIDADGLVQAPGAGGALSVVGIPEERTRFAHPQLLPERKRC